MTRRKYPGSIHNHTEFSNLRLRDCIIKVEDLISYAGELGHEIVAITDHEAISGHIRAQKAYKKIKEKYPQLKLVLGNEIYLCRNGLTADNFNKENDKYYHFILLAKDAIGHQQIRELSTRAWKRSYVDRRMRRVPTYYQDIVDIIGANPGHVIGSTACLGGALGTQIMKLPQQTTYDLMSKIEMWIERMKGIFGEGNFYLELQPSATKEQTYVNRKLIELSRLTSVPFIISTDTHYLKKEDKPIHKAYLNAQDGDREVDDFYATTYLMNTDELESYLDLTIEELEEAYDNIREIKEKCEGYDLSRPLKIPQLPWKTHKACHLDGIYDNIPWLNKFINSDYSGDKELALAIIEKIASTKELQTKEIYDAVDDCLKMTWESSEVNKTHWSAYFLNLQKIIEECWNAGSLVGCGRGSGVGFILLYLLDITQINPIWETTKTFNWRLTRKG